jgi:hypothetical protein
MTGDWRDYRRDNMRTGIQSLGCGGALEHCSSRRLGGGFQEVEIIPDGYGDILLADGGGIQRITLTGIERWHTKPFGAHWISGVFDLDGDGRFEILTSNGHEVIILSAEDGSLLFRDFIGPPISNGTYATMFQVHSFFGEGKQIIVPCFSKKEVLVYDCSDGAEHTRVLHRLWMNDSYHPSTTIGDVNGDGLDEIVIARIGGIYVFDPRNGEMLSETQWKSDTERRRNYGHFTLADVDGDGAIEAVILSHQVSRHVAVLDNDGHGNFSPLWDRFIEHIYPVDSTDIRYTSNSIADFDGDGTLEIAFSTFNEHKDGRWYTEVVRGTTGEKILELPDQYLRGVQDVDGDALPELCVSKESKINPRAHSDISVHSVKSDRAIWSASNAAFAPRTVHLKPNASEFKPDVFANQEIWRGQFNGLNGIFLESDKRLSILDSKLNLHATGFESSVSYRIADISNDCIIISQTDGELVSFAESTTHIRSCGYHLTPEAHASARPGSVATGINGVLAIPDFSGKIHVHNGNKHAIISGRSRTGYDGVYHAASIIETKQGLRLVIVDDQHLDHAQISLYTMQGERTNSYTFEDMPASTIGSRFGCYDWLYFEHSRGEALFASFYRSRSMNSECSLAFLLDTGEVLWRKERYGAGEYGRGIGAWGASALKMKEGRPTAIFCAKDTLCHLDLETGEFLRTPKLLTDYTAEVFRARQSMKEQNITTTSSIDDPFTAYCTSMLHGDDIVISGGFGGFGVIGKDGNAKWWKSAPFGDTLYRLPGIGDVDGDGRLEFAQSHVDGKIRIYDYETGVERAALDLKAIATDILTVDLNGDGRMEFVMGTNDGRLIAIEGGGNDFVARVVYETDSAMGSPIAADLDGDGTSEIYIVSGDGNLHCIV